MNKNSCFVEFLKAKSQSPPKTKNEKMQNLIDPSPGPKGKRNKVK